MATIKWIQNRIDRGNRRGDSYWRPDVSTWLALAAIIPEKYLQSEEESIVLEASREYGRRLEAVEKAEQEKAEKEKTSFTPWDDKVRATKFAELFEEARRIATKLAELTEALSLAEKNRLQIADKIATAYAAGNKAQVFKLVEEQMLAQNVENTARKNLEDEKSRVAAERAERKAAAKAEAEVEAEAAPVKA